MSKNKDSAEAATLDYLRSQNRPYSVNDIVANLHKEHGKAAIQKALDNLVKDEKVREKTYGKQKVYLVNQSGFKEAGPDELKEMESRIEDMEKSIKSSEICLKEAQVQLKELLSSLTTEQAQDQVSVVSKEVADLREKYKKLSETTVVVDVAERDGIRKKRETYLKEWRVRKRRCMEMLDAILENYPKSKQSLLEEIGIETDEEGNVVIPK